jgi:hypothetical protein
MSPGRYSGKSSRACGSKGRSSAIDAVRKRTASYRTRFNRDHAGSLLGIEFLQKLYEGVDVIVVQIFLQALKKTRVAQQFPLPGEPMKIEFCSGYTQLCDRGSGLEVCMSRGPWVGPPSSTDRGQISHSPHADFQNSLFLSAEYTSPKPGSCGACRFGRRRLFFLAALAR